MSYVLKFLRNSRARCGTKWSFMLITLEWPEGARALVWSRNSSTSIPLHCPSPWTDYGEHTQHAGPPGGAWPAKSCMGSANQSSSGDIFVEALDLSPGLQISGLRISGPSVKERTLGSAPLRSG